jgi:hypothetical protein
MVARGKLVKNDNLWHIQKNLKEMGHDPGPIDGLWGRRTRGAIKSLVENSGMPLATLPTQEQPELPWINECMTVYGLHETRDNLTLSRYLRSDGKFLGDPDKLPWCGDLVDTVTSNSLPDEPRHDRALKENPYWARNWGKFGVACPAIFGCYASFSRGSGGHVGWLVGQTTNHYLVLGGNQDDTVSVVKIAKNRLLETRWPITYPMTEYGLRPKVDIDRMTQGVFKFSSNEA